MRNVRRFLNIAFLLLRHGSAHLFGRWLRPWPALSRRLDGERPGPQRLTALLSDLGGTFVKFGQMLALQPDILPRAYCDALFDLLDRMPSFPYREVEATFIEETGRRPTDIFEYIESEPLASASIAQVHVAFVDGRKYAVKVQRPDAGADFAGDIRLMTLGVGLIRLLRLRSMYWVLELMGEFITWTREELDFRCEARYMNQLRANAGDNDRERVPQVLEEYTSRRILVVEYLDGVTALNYLRAVDEGDDGLLQRLADDGFDAEIFAGNPTAPMWTSLSA